MSELIFSWAFRICAIFIVCRIIEALISHWRGLLEIAFVVLCVIVGRGWDGLGVALIILGTIHLVRFVQKIVRKVRTKLEKHNAKSVS